MGSPYSFPYLSSVKDYNKYRKCRDEVDSLRSKVTPMKELTSQLFERSEVNVPGLSSRLCGEKNHLVF